MTKPVPDLSWGHININVSCLEDSIAFYQKLGFSLLLPGIPYLELNASGEAATMPDSAAGTTTRVETSSFVAPRP